MKDDAPESSTRYGKRKLDPPAYAAQAGEKRRTVGNVRYGRRKVDGPDPAPVVDDGAQGSPKGQGAPQNPFLVEPRPADVNHSGKVSVKEMLSMLRLKPELLDQAIAAEFARGKPRPTALVQLKTFEQRREGGPRGDVLRLIHAALESSNGEPPADDPGEASSEGTGAGAPGDVDPSTTGTAE